MFANMNEDFGDTVLGSDQLLPFGLGGLRNIGNTCYMNSVLQALSNCPHLTEFFLEFHDILDPNRKLVLFTHYWTLLSEFWGNERPRCFNANTILNAFCIVHPMFRGYAQQDAQEFLRLFLVQLHEELKHSRFLNSDKRGTKQTTPTGSSDSNSNSIITDVFQGRLVSSVRCLSCNWLSNREESFMDLSLSLTKPTVQTYTSFSNDRSTKFSLTNGSVCSGSLVKKGPVHVNSSNDIQHTRSRGSKRKFSSLSGLPTVVGRLVTGIPWLLNMILTLTHIFLSYVQSFLPSPKQWIDKWSTLTLDDCLSHYFSEAELVGENGYFCGRCNRRCSGLKQFRLLALPEILTLHLKRFSNNHLYSSKLSSPVNFPLKSLELSPYLHRDCTDKITIYDLIGVICHYGGCAGGHYITCAYNSSTEHWYEFNDEHVRRLNAEQVETLKSSAYILFYRKRDTSLEPLRHFWQLTPTEKMCYVSKPWIVRFWTWAEPGPMTSEFLCEHGYFRPELWRMRNSLTVSIPESFWSNLHEVFGGHPIIQQLIPCNDCCDAISKRQKYELSEIMRVSSPVTSSSTSYAISRKWLDIWLQFVKGQIWEAPGPIDNSDIIPCQKSIFSYRNSGSFNYSDTSPTPIGAYEYVSAEVWSLLFNIYGGGPVVPVCHPPYSSVNNLDENQTEENSSDHSSSEQLSSQKSSSNSTPAEPQNPMQNDKQITEMDQPNHLINDINNNTSINVLNNLGSSEDKSYLMNHWSVDDERNWENSPINNLMSFNGNDIHHPNEMYNNQLDNGINQSVECSQLNGSRSSELKKLINGCHTITESSYHSVSNSSSHQRLINNCSTSSTAMNIVPVITDSTNGYFGNYDPLDLVNHRNTSRVASNNNKTCKPTSHKHRRLVPIK
ncbi:Ubiquitin carboxyl-terminal hydrolase 20 [Schistosoma japonicum]|uniref:Ubiquitin carboxyl-terminal hydrolase n=1 Tax=Schistosoma japonicum TaxID=6182 RepID=A0A4Z2D8H5_SCHJA|nr:Ubiquitin carboxyl-terminal hydrolase 20 [Schistosoma japonicum]